MRRVAYIIPGYKESPTKQNGYGKVANLLQEAGIKPVHIKIDWDSSKPKTFRDYIKQFLRQYEKITNAETYVFGFSYGAVIAFLSNPKKKPSALILCSLSPYFEEDLKKIPSAWLRWWRKNFKESDYSFDKLASEIKIKTFLIAGDKEGLEIARRAKEAKKMIKKSTLVIAKNAKHDIGQKEYLKAVQRVIEKL